MPRKNHYIELLSPAGNLEKMKIAFKYGADAVYAGIPDFSLRVRINDFDFKKIKEAARYCHDIKKKIYITVNIFAHNRHLAKLPGYIRFLKECGVDGLIISDPGILRIVKKVWPGSVIHLSTQANCTNYEAAVFWQRQGISRIILGREVSLKEIREIKRKCPTLELEYFVHGAMCMAYSGRCFLSEYLTGRSANLGDCIQPCRWEYLDIKCRIPNAESRINIKSEDQNSKQVRIKDSKEEFEIVEEKHGSYILNSKDLCLIEYLPELIGAGVSSLKIEGRAKSVYYQAVVAGIYRKALNSIGRISREKYKKQAQELYKELSDKLVHRGYTEGFLSGEKAGQNLINSHNLSAWEFCGQVVKVEDDLIYAKVHNTIKTGDKIEIVKPYYDIIKMKIKELIEPKSGKIIPEAHGGQGSIVIFKTSEPVPALSVIRRRNNRIYK